ncbi:hypothetical protein [Nannocystis pusilla]|uniref:hypothetical protein n=1 Tax=Nannocystis pusilla TaxID=889268 RepID=UPI003B81727F
MPLLGKHPGLEGVLRLNRLDGSGLYYGRRGGSGPSTPRGWRPSCTPGTCTTVSCAWA